MGVAARHAARSVNASCRCLTLSSLGYPPSLVISWIMHQVYMRHHAAKARVHAEECVRRTALRPLLALRPLGFLAQAPCSERRVA